ncbi:MAG: TonB-dependent receptor [Bacteroidia bacterium]
MGILVLGNAQTLSGTITDADTKEAIPGVAVYIPDLKEGAVSDINGVYKISNLPKKKFLVQVQYLGYANVVVTLDFAVVTTKNFALKQSATEGNEVTITGVSQATEVKQSPVPIVSIDHEYLQQNMATNAIDAIAKVPGVSTVTTGPNVSKPFIRGLGYNRVLTTYDGLRQEGQQWGDEHGIEADEYDIDKIEIIKGPASLMYGSDALAGVVNIIPTPVAPEGKIQGEVLSEYQTNNGMIGNSAMLSGSAANGFEWLGRVSHKMAMDYQNKYDGRDYGTAFRETDASGTVGLNKSWGYSRLNFSVFDDLQEIPDGSRDSLTGQFTKQITEADLFRPVVSPAELNTYDISILHQHVQHYRLYTTNNFILGNGKLAVNLGYQESIRREYSHPTAPDVPGLDLVLNTFSYDTKYYFPEKKGWQPIVGINGMYQSNNSSQGTEAVIPSYNSLDAGAFAVVKKTFNRLEVSGGVRYDSRFFNNSALYVKPNASTGFDETVTGSDTLGASRPFGNYKHTFSGVTGSFGGSYDVTDKFLIKANIARGYRAPNIAEISANGVHPGTNVYQIGNPDLSPEFSLQEDLGFSYTSKAVVASLDLFNNDISNYIYNQKLTNNKGQDSVIVTGNQTFKYTASHAELYGGEFSLDIHPTDWLHFENGFSAVFAVNKGNGQPVADSAKYLPFIPPVHLTSDLRATFKKKYTHFSHLFAKAEVELFAAQNRVFLAYNTETPTPGYTIFNIGLGADITSRSGKTLFHFSVMGNNLFDAAYQDHLSRLKYFGYNYATGRMGMFNMGRNIGFKITVPLDLK